MDVLMIVHFTTFPWENGNGRFVYLADLLSMANCEVEMVTTTFFHTDKAQRACDKELLQSVPYKITMLHECGYPKNVCLKRIKSHKEFAKNLSAYLETRAKPDLVYCSVPSLGAAKVAAKYCQKNGVKFIIDIQDLWPEAFKMVFNVPVLGNIIYSPMERSADYVYSAADGVIAVSETYAARAMRVNKKASTAQVVYLGTDKNYFDECANSDPPATEDGAINTLVDKLQCCAKTENDGKLRLVYVGTLGNSYDLLTVFNAMRKLDKSVLENIEFIIMGDGPKRGEFEAASAGLPVVFTGNLSYPNMVWILTRCDVALNPIVKGAAQSIINKHMDYAMAGLPVISTQENNEYRGLLEKYNCGVNCRCENADEVAAAISELFANRQKAAELGGNSRRMGEEMFDRKSAYQKIIDIVCESNKEKK